MTTYATEEAREQAQRGFAATSHRRRWRGRPRPEQLPGGDWPELVARILALRGITDGAVACTFLAPPDASPDPYVLPALDMSVTEAAAALMISRQTLHRALAGKAAVSPEMALRLRKVLRERSGNLAQDAAGVRPLARAEHHRR